MSFVLLFINSAHADVTKQFAKDKISYDKIKQSLSLSVWGDDLIITDYSKSFAAYNPMGIMYPHEKYREISFSYIKDRISKKYSCRVSIDEKKGAFLIHSCDGSDKHPFRSGPVTSLDGVIKKLPPPTLTQDKNIKVISASCRGYSADITFNDPVNNQYTSNIFLRDDGSIQNIISTVYMKGTVTHQLDILGNEVSVNSTLEDENAKTNILKANRLYASKISKCCLFEHAEQLTCLREFNVSDTKNVEKRVGSGSR
ncbi:MAG: hypothetical protein KDD37_02475 [Bdellovibrionales bacterium]|nr:hypothetical protein [Bdellovibrionales bacterium]